MVLVITTKTTSLIVEVCKIKYFIFNTKIIFKFFSKFALFSKNRGPVAVIIPQNNAPASSREAHRRCRGK